MIAENNNSMIKIIISRWIKSDRITYGAQSGCIVRVIHSRGRGALPCENQRDYSGNFCQSPLQMNKYVPLIAHADSSGRDIAITFVAFAIFVDI